ncbi:MAG: HNH endonuclease [Sedimentisphaerales bacterium]
MASIQLKIPNWLDRICVWPLLLYRRLKFGEPYRRIYLGDGAYTKVDPDVYYEKCRFRWFLSCGNTSYAARTIKIVPQKTISSYLHREILKPPKGKVVDHRNNDPFNNLRSNLRPATPSQNMINRPKRINSSSKYIGVNWSKQHKKWRVAIQYRQKGWPVTKFLGYFCDEIEAARAYDIAALKYHKVFAHLNFPREDYVKTKTGYKFAGDSRSNKKSRSPIAKLSKIYSAILKAIS